MDSLKRVSGTTFDSTDKTRVHWQHCHAVKPVFDERVFDDHWLGAQGFIINSPSAGRGASLFLMVDQHSLVLRHYRRGGMVRRFSEKSYFWQGLQNTRAWREFDVLCALEKKGLPSPRPYACQVKRKGLVYSATLITRYLKGITLAERICSAPLTQEQWSAIGRCISQFHAAGVYHADLNAHNILYDESGHVSIIDFDRATINPAESRSRLENNLKRLYRSLQKIDGGGLAHYDEQCWSALVEGYGQTL